jgi:hypothetical protein
MTIHDNRHDSASDTRQQAILLGTLIVSVAIALWLLI